MLVHSEHCKKLAQAKILEVEGKVLSRSPVGIYSHHPFPREGLPEDIQEALVTQIHRILIKMKLAGHPAYSCPEMRDDLIELEKTMEWNRRLIWRERKIRPLHDKRSPLADCSRLQTKMQDTIQAEDAGFGDLWPTLQLLWGRFFEHHTVLRRLNNLKEPRNSVPLKMWDGLEDEVGLFPIRLQELIDAISSAEMPSFKELLSIYCGGSLEQICNFCGANVTVEAVAREVEGLHMDVPIVCILPFMLPMFHCGKAGCAEEFSKKLRLWDDWSIAVVAVQKKLDCNKCDFCFKLSEKVYR